MKKIVLISFIFIILVINVLSIYKYFNRCSEWDCSFLSQIIKNYKYSIIKEYKKNGNYEDIFSNMKDLNKDNRLSLREIKESIVGDRRDDALNAEEIKGKIISNMYLDGVNNNCFIFKLNINIDKDIKEYFHNNNYLKKYLRSDINNGGLCSDSDNCYFMLTEKGILNQEIIYNCE